MCIFCAFYTTTNKVGVARPTSKHAEFTSRNLCKQQTTVIIWELQRPESCARGGEVKVIPYPVHHVKPTRKPGIPPARPWGNAMNPSPSCICVGSDTRCFSSYSVREYLTGGQAFFAWATYRLCGRLTAAVRQNYAGITVKYRM